MKKRTILVIVTIVLFLTVASLGVWKWVDFVQNGIYLEASDSIPYAYTLYSDHVVLEKYVGTETAVTVPEVIKGKPVTEIGRECFGFSDQITQVILHQNIEAIGAFSFFRCSNLLEVNACKEVKTIGAFAFSECKSLSNIEIGDKIEFIDDGAFDSCELLKKLPAQENMLYIGQYAFYKSGLEEFSFNQDVQIGGCTFTETPWLQNQGEEFIIFGEGELIAYTGTDEVVYIPSGVSTLGYGCFYGTTASDIYLPQTVTTIKELTFCHCENVNVYIPDSVTEMEHTNWSRTIIDKDTAKNITIYTTKDSYAEEYAIELDLSYEIVEGW